MSKCCSGTGSCSCKIEAGYGVALVGTGSVQTPFVISTVDANSQLITPVTDPEVVRDTIAAALVAGSNMTITSNDAANTITISSVGGGTTDPEVVRDAIGSALVAGSNITINADDVANTITVSAAGLNNGTQIAVTSPSTATIQAAIDSLASTGGVVRLPGGRFAITASTLSESYDNFGVAQPASGFCLILRKNVSLVGAGAGATELFCLDATKTLIGQVAPENCVISGMTLTGGYSVGVSGAGHGILTLGTASGADQKCRNNVWRDLYIRQVASYGLGLQNGYPRGCRIEDVIVENIGADGVDLKARGFTQVEPSGNTVNNLVVRNHGQRVTGSCGVDTRGIWHMANVTVTDFGTVAGLQFEGIRFRTKDDTANYWLGVGSRGSLTNFYVRPATGAASTDLFGLIIGSDNVSVTNGVIDGCSNGVQFAGNTVGSATNCRVTNVHAIQNSQYGFWVTQGPSGITLTGCFSSQNGTAGFRNEGTATTLIGCSGTETAVLSTSSGGLPTQTVVGGTLFPDRLTFGYPTAGRAQMAAVGDSTDIDIVLTPKGAGTLRFGTLTSSADAPVSGYILVKDSSGVSRKVAVIS